MQFATPLLLAATATTVAADGIFAINGTGIISSPTTITLEVLNGLVGDPPTCSGSIQTAPLPTSGTIPCKDGYSLTFAWNSVREGIAATYATPSSPAFTYNVPNLGCDGGNPNTCTFGFENLFPGKKVRGFKESS